MFRRYFCFFFFFCCSRWAFVVCVRMCANSLRRKCFASSVNLLSCFHHAFGAILGLRLKDHRHIYKENDNDFQVEMERIAHYNTNQIYVPTQQNDCECGCARSHKCEWVFAVKCEYEAI